MIRLIPDAVPPIRKSVQDLLPLTRPPVAADQYNIYPTHPLAPGDIQIGCPALAQAIIDAKRATVILDGCVGVLWDDLRARLDRAFSDLGCRVQWISVAAALRSEAAINDLIAPFLGGDDPIFGTRFIGDLAQFFDSDHLASLAPDPAADLTIIYGCGAALVEWEGLLIYCDIPRNEIQFRARAGSITNLGAVQPADPKTMYKRFYFVDWPVLNRHKAAIWQRIDLLIDGQHPDQPAFAAGKTIRAALTRLSRSSFRVRPWFEPGVWGGQWIKHHIPHVAQDVQNYAWSFELITPENGLLFESDGHLFESAFDGLMIQESRAVLGDAEKRFGLDFPIRFDFLDTIDGENLSIQCHPRPEYMKAHFGESFTQDETYYILTCTPDAQVYLGFQAQVEPDAFQAAVTLSAESDSALDVARFIQSHPAEPHGLYLIPAGTIHGAGKNNLVLEISATPYIFTFKIYDWQRVDLDGQPRPINLARAIENLCFDRQGDVIPQEFIAHPVVIGESSDPVNYWRVVHLPTHAEHFYDVHRLEFSTSIVVETHGSVHVLSLVEGRSVILRTAGGQQKTFAYAETFVVPAAAERYELINSDDVPIKVIKAFIKPA